MSDAFDPESDPLSLGEPALAAGVGLEDDQNPPAEAGSPPDLVATIMMPSPRRLGVVLALIGLMLVALVGRVAYLQTVMATRIVAKAERQQDSRQTLPARRGSLFDRNGLMLAGSVQTTALYADPKFMAEQFLAKGESLADMDDALEKVARVVRADPDEVVMDVGRDPRKRYVSLAHHLGDAAVEQLRAMDVPGLGFEPEPERIYPMGQTAAHLLGAVGSEHKGLEGLERVEDAVLAGTDGTKRTVRDKRRRVIAADAGGYRLPEHGEHLILTLDSNIQLIAEEELEKQVKETHAKSGCVIVMDPQTGDVLALANYPTYFPQYLADSQPAARRNRAITDPYEPGSVMKPFLLSGLIEAGVTRIGEQIPIGDSRVYRTPYGRRVTDTHFYAPKLAVWDVLVKSSNVGMVKLGERVDEPFLKGVLDRFGFGHKAGLETGGEDAGRVPQDWTKYTRESVMQGYEMLVTPMQLARAMCAIANGGTLVSPHVVAGVYEPGGEMRPQPRTGEEPRVMRPDTAALLRRVLADIPRRGTATRAKLAEWTVFGKTGTSHKSVGGSYNETAYNATFVGGAPYENPRLVICVNINEPDKSLNHGQGHYGGVAAAPAASRILQRSLTYLNVPHSGPLPDPPPEIADVLYQFKSKVAGPDGD